MTTKYITYTIIALACIGLCFYIVNGFVSNIDRPQVYPDTIVEPVAPADADTGFEEPSDGMEQDIAPVHAEDLVLDGSSFRLTSYNGTAVPASATYTLSFAEGKLSAKFCNGLGGAYILKGPTLTATQLMGTKMYCAQPANLMTMEDGFGKMLSEGAIVTHTETTITLKNPTYTFVYTKL